MADKEYIERNALIAEYDRIHIGPAGGARKLMVDAPAADVVEVRRGEWIEKDRFVMHNDFVTYCCSICETKSGQSYKFCPNCGAKMDVERKEKKHYGSKET